LLALALPSGRAVVILHSG